MNMFNLAIAILMTGLAGFLLGKYSERISWNKLIHDGKIPKPYKDKEVSLGKRATKKQHEASVWS